MHMQHRIAEAHLFTIDRLIAAGVLRKVDNTLPNSPRGKRCLLITCGDLFHRKDQQEYWERKLGVELHIYAIPGGAVELSPYSPRNRRFPDFDPRMRDIARILVAQKPDHIMPVGHFQCGAATSLDDLDPVAIAWHVKKGKEALIDQLAHNPRLRDAVNGKDIWQPKEEDISCYLHCFTGKLTDNISQERTMWFITHGLLDWVAKHDPTLKVGLLA